MPSRFWTKKLFCLPRTPPFTVAPPTHTHTSSVRFLVYTEKPGSQPILVRRRPELGTEPRTLSPQAPVTGSGTGMGPRLHPLVFPELLPSYWEVSSFLQVAAVRLLKVWGCQWLSFPPCGKNVPENHTHQRKAGAAMERERQSPDIYTLPCVKQIASGNLLYAQGAQLGALW